MQFTETMTPSRRLMEHLFGEDAPAVRHALLECGPTRSDDPVDQLIDAMAEAEFASLMDDLARRAKVSTNSPDAIVETSDPTPPPPNEGNIVPISMNTRRSRQAVRFIASNQQTEEFDQEAAARHSVRKDDKSSDVFSITWEQEFVVWELRGRRNSETAEVILLASGNFNRTPKFVEWRKPRGDTFDLFPVRPGTDGTFYVDIDLGKAAIRESTLNEARNDQHTANWEERLPMIIFDDAHSS